MVLPTEHPAFHDVWGKPKSSNCGKERTWAQYAEIWLACVKLEAEVTSLYLARKDVFVFVLAHTDTVSERNPVFRKKAAEWCEY